MSAFTTTTKPKSPRAAFSRDGGNPSRRRISDLVRLVVAGGLLAIFTLRATHALGNAELDLDVLFASFSRGLSPLARATEGLGTLWAVGLVVAAALVGRRWKLARDLLIAGVIAWATARVLGTDIVGRVSLHASLRTVTHTGVTPSFPGVRLSVLVAVVTTASPYIRRPARRLGQTLIVVGALAGLYLGRTNINDLLGGLTLGWGVAALVHLAFGSPGGRPSTSQVQTALDQIGIHVSSVATAANQTPDATVFECSAPDGALIVKAIGRDELDAQLFAKLWRYVTYKEPPPLLQLTRYQQVEHEACMGLLARAAGIPVPDVVFVGRAGSGAALLVVRRVPGERLSEIDPEQITDQLLDAIWAHVARLHDAGLSHGALDARHIVVEGGRAHLIDFALASAARSDYRQSKDVAELLAATAALVGDERAAKACVSALSRASVRDALPFLQAAALRRTTRASIGGNHRAIQQRLDDLRQTMAGLAAIDVPELPQLARIRPASAVLAASVLVGVAVLLAQVNPSSVWDIVEHAQWGWVLLALAVSLATNIPYAVALMGTIPIRLPLWPTSELQLGMSYPNLVIPVIGGTGFQIRFLQRQGADLSAAVAAGGLLSVVGTVATQLPLFVVAVLLSPDDLHLGGIHVASFLRLAAVVIVAVGLLAAVALGIPQLRRHVLPPLRQGAATIWAALRSGRQLALLIGGNLAVSLLYGVCLLACLFAFGASLSYWTVLAAAIGVSTISALVPIPGGGTAVGSVGLAGVLAGLGVPTQVAVAATLTNQLVVTYVPAVPGWFATRDLLHRGYL